MEHLPASEAAEKLVQEALKRGFSEAAAIVLEQESTMVKFANSEVSVVQNWDSLSVALYLAKGDKILLTSIHPTSLEQVSTLVDRALAVAAKVRPSFIYAPLPEPEKVDPVPGLVDRAVIDAMHDPAPLADAMLSEVTSAERAAGALTLLYSERGVATSRGAKLEEASTSLEAYLRVFIGESSGQWAHGGRRLSKEAVEQVAKTAMQLAEMAKGRPAEVEPGTYDVLLSPMVVGNLVNLVGRMASGMSVLMGMSIFARVAPGAKVASDKLTLYDDPRNPELLGSASFDDEGQPTRSKPIIESGVLKTLLHNSKTAAKFNTKSTGNAGLLFPHPWALRVAAGDAKLEEMIAEVKRGLLITNNWYTRLQNYVEGIFSTIARDAALYVESGEVKCPVARVRIADKLPRLLNSIDLIGKDVYDISWWEVRPAVRAPYVLVRGIGISRPFV